ncbi:MAG: tail fiber domain-containing protein [Flavitalea sp.]
MKLKLFFLPLAFVSFYVTAQVGVGTTTPNSMLDVRGSLSTNFRTSATAITLIATDNTVVFTGTVTTTFTLPTAVGIQGRTYWIKNGSTTLPTPILNVTSTSSQTIDGTATTWVLDEPNEMVCFVSNGSNWFVLNQDVAVAKTSALGSAWLQGGNRVTASKSIGTITDFDLPFITNNIERMRLMRGTSAGFLGLGTNNPSGRLHVVTQGSETGDDYIFDDYGAGTTQGLYLSKSRGTIGSPSDLALNDQIGYLRFVPRYNGTLGSGPGSSMEAFYKGSGTNELTDLRFFTSNTERMRINEFGNVAIGTSTFNATNPERLLVDAGSTLSFNVISGKGSINNYLQLNIQNRADSASASSDIVASSNNGSETANFIDMGINSSVYSNAAAPILNGVNTAYLYSTGKDLVIGNSTANNLIFFTNGFATTDEKMRISSTGNTGIGATPSATEKLTVGGNVIPSVDNSYTLGKTGLRWSAVWSANGVIQTSDARLKTNIQALNYGLKEVMAMRPVRYNWISNPQEAAKIGLIAQEVRALVPEVVIGDERKENLGMNYAELIPVLINAIQEQQSEIDAIEKNIAGLKKK